MNIFRRHLQSCRHRKKRRSFTGCQCPIWVDGILSGKRHHKTLKTTVWQRAVRKLAAFESGENPAARGIEQATAAWDAHLVAKHIRASTLRKYRRLMRQFSEWCEKEGYLVLEKVSVEALDSFRSSRGHIGALTSIKELQVLRSFFSFCLDRGWCTENPAKKIAAPKATQKEKVPYTPLEMTAILASCDLLPEEYERLRTSALILLMRHTGLRIGDAAMLRKDRVRNGEVFLHTQKTGTPVILPIPRELLGALDSLPVPIGADLDCGYYFYNRKGKPDSLVMRAHRLLHSVFLKSRVRNAHSHRFRHSLASDILAAGYTTDHVADILGISPQIARKHYIKWTVGRQREIKQVMEAVNRMRGPAN